MEELVDNAALLISGAALLTMAMLGWIILYQRHSQQQLRAQLTLSEEQRQTEQTQAAEQQHALQNQLAEIRQERDDLKVTSPIEWTQCLACRSPLQVVLCPSCHAPYHKERAGPNGKTLHCWDAILQSGRCWSCRQDLTIFQKVPANAGTVGSGAPQGNGVEPTPIPGFIPAAPLVNTHAPDMDDDGDDFKILA